MGLLFSLSSSLLQYYYDYSSRQNRGLFVDTAVLFPTAFSPVRMMMIPHDPMPSHPHHHSISTRKCIVKERQGLGVGTGFALLSSLLYPVAPAAELLISSFSISVVLLLQFLILLSDFISLSLENQRLTLCHNSFPQDNFLCKTAPSSPIISLLLNHCFSNDAAQLFPPHLISSDTTGLTLMVLPSGP